jgi:lauroyl/myristoyl acyltransferase
MTENRALPRAGALGERRSSPALSPQAPEVVPWHRKLLGRYHLTGDFWYRFHLFGVTVLPRFMVAPVVLAFTLFFFAVLRRIRGAVARNLEPVLGRARWGFPERGARVWRTLWNHAWCLTETYEGLGPGRGVSIETEGEEHWQALSVEAAGFIVLTAHVGHWEVGSRVPAARETRRVHVVREPEIDGAAQEFLSGLLRRHCGERFEIHYARSEDAALGLTLLQALRRGELVAVQGDRPRAGGQSQVVKLFGKSFLLPVGPAALARAADVPLLPLFVFRRGRARSRVVFRPPIRVVSSSDRREDLRAALQCFAGHLEWAIRQAPHQWFCFRDAWGAPGD